MSVVFFPWGVSCRRQESKPSLFLVFLSHSFQGMLTHARANPDTTWSEESLKKLRLTRRMILHAAHVLIQWSRPELQRRTNLHRMRGAGWLRVQESTMVSGGEPVSPHAVGVCVWLSSGPSDEINIDFNTENSDEFAPRCEDTACSWLGLYHLAHFSIQRHWWGLVLCMKRRVHQNALCKWSERLWLMEGEHKACAHDCMDAFFVMISRKRQSVALSEETHWLFQFVSLLFMVNFQHYGKNTNGSLAGRQVR